MDDDVLAYQASHPFFPPMLAQGDDRYDEFNAILDAYHDADDAYYLIPEFS